MSSEPCPPALPPSDESEDSEFQESEKDALFIKLIDCYWALQSRVLTHNRSEEVLTLLSGTNIFDAFIEIDSSGGEYKLAARGCRQA